MKGYDTKKHRGCSASLGYSITLCAIFILSVSESISRRFCMPMNLLSEYNGQVHEFVCLSKEIILKDRHQGLYGQLPSYKFHSCLCHCVALGKSHFSLTLHLTYLVFSCWGDTQSTSLSVMQHSMAMCINRSIR